MVGTWSLNPEKRAQAALWRSFRIVVAGRDISILLVWDRSFAVLPRRSRAITSGIALSEAIEAMAAIASRRCSFGNFLSKTPGRIGSGGVRPDECQGGVLRLGRADDLDLQAVKLNLNCRNAEPLLMCVRSGPPLTQHE